MALTVQLSDRDDHLLSERARSERRSREDVAAEAIHVFLSRRTSA